MSQTMRDELKRLMERLDAAPAMAETSCKSVAPDIRHAYMTGYLQGMCLNVAEDLRKLLVRL